jgi:fatty-acyl-CoA synthase
MLLDVDVTDALPDRLSPGTQATLRPHAAAIVFAGTGEVTTYAQLEERSLRFATALRSRGVGVGDHVAILLENNRPFLEVAWAAQRAGLHYTAVSTHLLASEVQYILDDSGARVLVSSPALAGVVADLDLSNVPVRISTSDGLHGFERYDDLLDSTPAGPLADEQEGREMLYSSGTTGRPKGVRKPLPGTPVGDRSAPAVQIALGQAARGIGPDKVMLCPAPLYHSAPLLAALSAHRLGANVVVMARFDAEECLRLIEQHRVTHAQFVPTMFTRLLRLPEPVRAQYDLSSLEVVQHGAAPCPIPVKRQMIDWWGPIIYEYYGGTEELGWSTISSEEWLAHPGSVGRPAQECHILGDDGDELPPGQPGLIYFAGGRAFEYHNDEAKTASITNERGWRTLGDIGFLDEDGYLYLTDRQAHMIISGGVNIYPQEAENVLAAHPGVADVAVIGVPDDEMGEAVKAVVQPADPTAPGPDLATELLAYCRVHLAAYKCPRSVDFVDDLPRGENGKLYKRQLRERYWQGHDSLVR